MSGAMRLVPELTVQAPTIQVDQIDPLMFAQCLADRAGECTPRQHTLKVTLMIASAMILDLAGGGVRSDG